MEIEKLGGTTERLYRLSCTFGYETLYSPGKIIIIHFKTSMHHIWFIAIEEERVVGFMPVEIKTNML